VNKLSSLDLARPKLTDKGRYATIELKPPTKILRFSREPVNLKSRFSRVSQKVARLLGAKLNVSFSSTL
jgi:hypothetical protein